MTRRAVLVLIAALASVLGVSAAVQAAVVAPTASCTANPAITDGTTSQSIRVTCSWPKPPAVTTTVTRTVTATPTASPTASPSPTVTPTSSPSPTATATTPAAFPDATTTGVPAGVTLTAAGALNITVDGTVIDAKNITGGLIINASNVTIKRSRITGGGWWEVKVANTSRNVVIEDCDIDGKGSTEGSAGVFGPSTVVRTDIRGVENGVTPGTGSVLRDSYIHDLLAPGSAHYDGVQMDGDLSNVLIQHNTVDLHEHWQTSAVMVDNDFGAVSNIVVDSNRLLGGGYTVYADGRFNSTPMTGVVFTNNRLGKGGYGYAMVNPYPVTWSGNTDDTTGQPVNI